jgi:anti-anti-sigma regulatory factor
MWELPCMNDALDHGAGQLRQVGAAEPSIEVRTGLGRGPRYVSLVTLQGELDLGSRPRLEKAFEGLHGHVLVDLAQCELIDTATINTILTKHRELRREGYTLELLVPPARVHLTRIFDLLGIRNLVTIRDRPPFPL